MMKNASPNISPEVAEAQRIIDESEQTRTMLKQKAILAHAQINETLESVNTNITRQKEDNLLLGATTPSNVTLLIYF